jgi:hypothetical protein
MDDAQTQNLGLVIDTLTMKLIIDCSKKIFGTWCGKKIEITNG